MGDIFQIVSLSRRSGTLQLTTPVESGEIVFRAGKVVAAYRTNAKASVGEGLLEAGVVSPTVYQDMLAAQKGGKRAAELFTHFSLDQDALQGALEGILKQVVYTMFEWNEGTFSFVLEDAPDVWRGFTLEGARAVAENGLNPQYLAIEGARLRDERTKEDTLASFLAKSEPQTATRGTQSLNVQEIAAKLRSAAELDGAAAPSERAIGDAEKVIPFPAERVRARGTTPVSDPAAGSPAASTPPESVAEEIADRQLAPLEPAPTGLAKPTARAATSEAGRSHETSVAPVPVGVVTPASRHRLLAVDDDPQVTRYIRHALGDRFRAVITADTVQEALVHLEADARDLVVASDLIIARSDGRGILGGIEILERVRARWADLPVVLFTDYQNEEAEARARSMGALAVLLKPRKAQVQAAAKEGGAGVVTEFLTALATALAPYFGAPGASAPALSASAPPALASSPATALEASSAVPPDEASRSDRDAPAGAAAFDLGSEMMQEMDEVGRSLAADLPPAMLSAGEMGVLRSMLAELIDPANRETVTLLVLRFASHLVERAGLFLATRRAFAGLGGFSIDEPSDRFVARVRRIQIPVQAESVFGQVARFRAMIRAPLKDAEGNRVLVQGFGGPWPPSEIIAAPLISGDRVAAILFGDNPSGKPLGSTDSLEIFLQQAGLAMDRALLERKLEDSRRHRGSD